MSESLDSRYIRHLRAQAKSVPAVTADSLACPYCHRYYAKEDAFYAHVTRNHYDQVQKLGFEDEADIAKYRELLKEQAIHTARILASHKREENKPPVRPSSATTGSTPDLNRLTLEAKRSPTRKGEPPPSSPFRISKKRPGSDVQPGDHPSRVPARKELLSSRAVESGNQDEPDVMEEDDPDYSRNIPFTVPDGSGSQMDSKRLFDPRGSPGGCSGQRMLPGSKNVKPEIAAHLPVAQRRGAKTHRQHLNANSRYDRKVSSPAGTPGSPGVASLSPTYLPQRQPGVLEMPPPADARYPDLLLQPDSRPISQEQLAAEVKSIYAGLTMVESKCIHVDKAQAAAFIGKEPREQPTVSSDHWQALIALHRTLLHEHHDFFLASQHPSASPALRRLAAKYSMPARMWKHGIHSFLEVLRYRLPESLDFMLSFIYLAYQMVALLYETIPTFEDTWIECLGDLGRYRMAIEDEDLRDRETWAAVARFWYTKAAHKAPTVGRLYHHLAILARPNALQQLYYYSRSLTCVQPFLSARESIQTLFNPMLGRSHTSYYRSTPADASFVKAHAIIYEKQSSNGLDGYITEYFGLLDNQIGRLTVKWKEQGCWIAITNIASLFDYGFQRSVLCQIFQYHNKRITPAAPANDPSTSSEAESPSSPDLADLERNLRNLLTDQQPDAHTRTFFLYACQITFSTFARVLRRGEDKNILSHVHILLAFLLSLASILYVAPESFELSSIFDAVSWEETALLLNRLTRSEDIEPSIDCVNLQYADGDNKPLPEDYLMRGQLWSQEYLPETWFQDSAEDEEERSLERASTGMLRSGRVLGLGVRIAAYGRWLHYDAASRIWSAAPSLAHSEQRGMLHGSSALPGRSQITTLESAMDHITASDKSDQPPSLKLQMIADTGMDLGSMAVDPVEAVDVATSENSPLSRRSSEEQTQLQSSVRAVSGQLMLSPVEPLSRTPSVQAAKNLILRHYTVMVCDTDMLLRDTDVFQMLVESGDWSVVIPDSVIAELLDLAGAGGSDSVQAYAALNSVKTAISTGRNIRILTETGKNITDQVIEMDQAGSHSGILGAHRDLDEVTIGVVRQQSDLSKHIPEAGGPGHSSDGPEAAILVTEDKDMEGKAEARGVKAIAASKIRRILKASKRRLSRASSQGQVSS